MNINEQDFEQLWSRAAVKPFVDEMNDGLPKWRQQRRNRRNGLLGFAAVCLIGSSVLFTMLPGEKRYDSIACNRTNLVDDYWLQIADDMLITKV